MKHQIESLQYKKKIRCPSWFFLVSISNPIKKSTFLNFIEFLEDFTSLPFLRKEPWRSVVVVLFWAGHHGRRFYGHKSRPAPAKDNVKASADLSLIKAYKYYLFFHEMMTMMWKVDGFDANLSFRLQNIVSGSFSILLLKQVDFTCR